MFGNLDKVFFFNRRKYILQLKKTENGNGRYIKETTSRPKRRKHHKATHGFSKQRKNLHNEAVVSWPKIINAYLGNRCIIILRNQAYTVYDITVVQSYGMFAIFFFN